MEELTNLLEWIGVGLVPLYPESKWGQLWSDRNGTPDKLPQLIFPFSLSLSLSGRLCLIKAESRALGEDGLCEPESGEREAAGRH